MQPHVFISYSSYDREIADAICSKLESNHIHCWIAPRDILPGIEYGEAIIDAINNCTILLLVFSTKANDSPQVRKEVERAISKGKIIIPFRTENILPTKAMEFALSNTHWLDAMNPPLEKHILKLSDTITRFLNAGLNISGNGSNRTGHFPPKVDQPADEKGHTEILKDTPTHRQVTDYDGNIYNTVTIGNQVWMAENLKVSHYRNGDQIPDITDAVQWGKLSTGARCSYGNLAENIDKYGYLYNWFAVNDQRSVSPVGWHIPSGDEWDQLCRYISDKKGPFIRSGICWNNVGISLKSATSWNSDNNGSNDFGFSGLPGGLCIHGEFYDIGYFGLWWSSTENSAVAMTNLLSWNNSNLYMGNKKKTYGISVRCIKD